RTVSTRQPLDQDQFAQVFGVEGGINPNYPFLNWAAFYQGWQSFPGERLRSGVGTSLTAGFRDLGWQVGVSAEALKLFDNQPSEFTAGPMWALNAYPLSYIGQLDARLVFNDSAENTTGIFTYHELNWMMTRGLTGQVAYGWMRTDGQRPESQRSRLTLGLQWDIVTHL